MSVFATLETDLAGVLSDVEAAFLTFFRPLLQQIEANGGQVLLDAVSAGLTTAMATGGAPGAIISAAATSAISTLEAQGKPVVTNAVYGALAAAAASLSLQNPNAATPAPTPAA